MLGRNAMAHALYKMSIGLIDPSDVESAFYPLKKLLHERRAEQARREQRTSESRHAERRPLSHDVNRSNHASALRANADDIIAVTATMANAPSMPEAWP